MSYIRPYPPSFYGPPPPARPPPGLFQTHSSASTPASGMSMLITRQPPPQHIPRGDRCLYGRSPCRIECQYCGDYVTTHTEYMQDCCLMPCCSEGDIIHICPCCRNVVGRYDPRVNREQW